jgi:hypothetical protein
MMSLTWLAAALLTAGAGPSVDVRGDTECPSPAELSAALVGLVPASATPASPDVAELRAVDGVVSVRLVNAKGDVIAEKILPASPSCAEKARTAAVIIAAWEARIRAGMLGGLSVPRPERAPPPPTPPPVVQVKIVEAPARPAMIVRDVAPPAPLQIEPGAAVFASLVSGELAAGLLAEAALSRRDAPFALGIGGLAVGTHATTVGPGQGSWRRFGGVVDGRARSSFGSVELELRAGLAMTALSIEGRSLPKPTSTTMFDPGALVGLRGKLRAGSVSPWLEGTFAFWPSSHNLYLSGTNDSADLPSAEALLSVGVAFVSGR